MKSQDLATYIRDPKLDNRYDAFVDILKTVDLYPSTIARALYEAYGLDSKEVEASVRKFRTEQAGREDDEQPMRAMEIPDNTDTRLRESHEALMETLKNTADIQTSIPDSKATA